MKAFTFSLIFCMLILGNPVKPQNSKLPGVDLYTLDGVKISASDLNNTDTLLVLIFWKSNNRQSFNQLLEINEEYQEWLKATNVKVVGICTDLNGTRCDIKPLVYAHNIDFEVYIDKNNDFKRAMNIPDIPYLIMVDNHSENIKFMGYYPDIAEFINNKIDLQLAAIPVGK